MNVYAGPASTSSTYMNGSYKYGPFISWLIDYYAAIKKANASTGGRPNVHLYFGGLDSGMLSKSAKFFTSDPYHGLEIGLKNIQSAVPAIYKDKVLITEMGFGAYESVTCPISTGGMPTNLRNKVYKEIMLSPVLRNSEMEIFWRFFQLDPDNYISRVIESAKVTGAWLPENDPQGYIRKNLSCETSFGVINSSWEKTGSLSSTGEYSIIIDNGAYVWTTF